jgi:hypothetical protein
MKITLFSIILLFSINGFAANWKKLSENKSGSSFYVDVENIKEHNGFVYYWTLIDYRKSTKIGFSSNISEYKVNCVDEKQTWLSNTFYSQPMAKGKIITEKIPVWNYYGSTLNEIRSLTLGSLEHNILKEVCHFESIK